MKLTEDKIAQARLVNLPDFLRSNGFNLTKSGRWYRTKEHPSLCIYDNDVGVEGKWYHHSQGHGGDNIAFLEEYMDMSFTDAVLALNGESRQFYLPAPSPRPPEEPKIFCVRRCSSTNMLYEYLCKKRKLSRLLISELIENGSLAEESKTFNAVFFYYDDNGKAIGAEKVGTGPEKFKRTAWGSAPGQGFVYQIGKGESALFFESAIDMLSYVDMYRKSLNNCRLYSMMGLKQNIVEHIMEKYQIPEDKVYICSDNDKAGNAFYSKMSQLYPHMRRLMCEDKYKDWNDQLRGIKRSDGARVWVRGAKGIRLARPKHLNIWIPENESD